LIKNLRWQDGKSAWDNIIIELALVNIFYVEQKGIISVKSKKIDEIDQNLKINTSLPEKNIRFYDVRQEPFRVYGLYNYRNEPVFKRIPDHVAAATNDGVKALYLNTAGGRVRFSTDSEYVAIKAIMPSVTVFPHMTLAGTSGFDLYIDDDTGSTYYGTFMPPIGMKDGYESIIYFPDSRRRDLTINFPLYNNVDSLYIGLKNSAIVDRGREYRYSKPVLYYGSSITQGACASRPGNSYEAIISRRYDCDYINLGFSGSARGEDSIAEYMSDLDVSLFVCDYDHNAPDVGHLRDTHEKLFKKFRSKSAELPVIFVSRPNFEKDTYDSIMRRDVIYTTYINAIRSGDKNVYFIDGQALFKDENRDCCTVDTVHPNDAGFVRMAEIIGHTVGRILKAIC